MRVRSNSVTSWLGLCLFGAVLGCGKTSKPSPSRQESVTTVAPPVTPTPEVPSPKTQATPPVPIATEETVRSFVEGWLAAQNAGDFSAYQTLYAQKFTGVKRVGSKEVSLSRQGWMEDRAALFKKPFTVQANGTTLTAAPGIFVVKFEQTWKNDRFSDKGQKQLVLVLEHKKLRISREEMLTSQTEDAQKGPQVPFEKAAVAEKTKDSYVLLVPAKVSLDWVIEHPEYLSEERAQRAVLTSALPAELQALLSDSYELINDKGETCVKKPRGFQVMVHLAPHFGTYDEWEDRSAEYEGRTPHPVPPAARALDLWKMAQIGDDLYGHPALVLGLEMEDAADCKNPTWGRKKVEGAKEPWVVSAVSGQLLDEVKSAVSRHPLVKRVESQKRATGEGSSGPWLESVDERSFKLISGPGGVELIYAVALGEGGCNLDTPPSVDVLFRKQGTQLVPLLDQLSLERLSGVVDLDGDGVPELIDHASIVVRSGGVYMHVVDHSGVSLQCGC